MSLLSFKNGNWGLKFLALVLAIIIYYTIKNESASGRRHYDRNPFQQQSR